MNAEERVTKIASKHLTNPFLRQAILEELKEYGDSKLREAQLANCPACRGDMPHSKDVVFVRGDDIWMHPGPSAADNMYPCGSVGIRGLTEDE